MIWPCCVLGNLQLVNEMHSHFPPYSNVLLIVSQFISGKTTCCLYRLWDSFRLYWLRFKMEEDTEIGKINCTEPYRRAFHLNIKFEVISVHDFIKDRVCCP